jgi:hypothetical protein
MSFIKHPVSEINDIRIKTLQESIISKLELHKTGINDSGVGYFPTGNQPWLTVWEHILSPDEEQFWKKYISKLINEKINYINMFNNSDTMLFNLKFWQKKNKDLHMNIYNQCKYGYLTELETLF